MSDPQPPPLPGTRRTRLERRRKVIIGFAVAAALCLLALVILRVLGLIRPFNVPTTAMSPAASPGDHLMIEGFSFLSQKPRRGDIVVFKADGIQPLERGSLYIKRIVGEPGDHVQIFASKLYINDTRVVLSNGFGEIAYPLPQGAERMSPQTDVMVPNGRYYVLGDNATNSSDSRFWGSLPATNILGRIAFCYWPPKRAGVVK